MKYIKSYKLFESDDKYFYVENYVNDVISHLQDSGFECSFRDYPDDDIFIFKIEKKITHRTEYNTWQGNSTFKWEDIKDGMTHILSFLKSEGNKIDNFDIEGPKMLDMTQTLRTKSEYGNKIDELGKNWFVGVPDDLELFSIRIVFTKPQCLLEKKSKRKIGWFQKWCHNLGYSGVKNGKCYGRKKKHVKQMDFGKDYYYDIVDGKNVIPKVN